MSIIINYIFIILAVLAILTPIILSFILKFNKFYLSIYGIYIIIYFILQTTFAYLNNKKAVKRNVAIKKFLSNIIVVGYREDPELFRNCLLSIKEIDVREYNKLYVVIDGNTNEDEYMCNIFKQVFMGGDILRLDGDSFYNTIKIPSAKWTCITQPHKGKRDVLYTGFKLSIIERNLTIKNNSIKILEGVLTTDSDTILDKNIFDNMRLGERDGAITGNMFIIPEIKYKNFFSFLNSLRYYMACNIERAYQSYSGNTLCVGGPIGLYKLSDLEQFLDTWKNQTYLNKPCTYGDDRHLTNNILILGKKVIYTPLAFCFTETPTNFYKLYKQQIRWCKSSYREVFWNLKCLDKHSIFMTIDLIYIFIYSLLVTGSLIYILFSGTALQLGLYFCFIFGSAFLKGVYISIYEKSPEFLFYSLYSLIYLSIIIPSKLHAGITMTDTTWGTNRVGKQVFKFDIITLIIWNGIFVSGVIYNIIMNKKDLSGVILTCSVLLIILLKIFILLIYLTFKKLKKRPRLNV